MSVVSQHPDAPQRRPKDRKQRIIIAARDLFAERGYPNVSMALIAESLGITAGALYRHFDNKEVLLEEVFRHGFAYLSEPVVGETLADAVDSALDAVAAHPYGSELWNSEVKYLGVEARVRLREQMRGWIHSFARMLEAERPDDDEEQIELMVWAIASVLAFVGSITTRASTGSRRPVARAAALAISEAELVPTGEPVTRRGPALAQVSTRERLLRSAVEQFSSQGYQDSSMSSIGARADVTGPNLYAYFDSKADLLRAVQERANHLLWIHVDVALRRADSMLEAMQNLVAGQVEIAADWPALRLELTGEENLEQASRTAQRGYVAEWVAVLRGLRPDLDSHQARLRSLVAIKVINDLSHTPHVARRTTFVDNVSRIAMAILLAEPTTDR